MFNQRSNILLHDELDLQYHNNSHQIFLLKLEKKRIGNFK